MKPANHGKFMRENVPYIVGDHQMNSLSAIAQNVFFRTVEAPMVTRLSLSLASAQADFAMVGVMFVSLLRKTKARAQQYNTS